MKNKLTLYAILFCLEATFAQNTYLGWAKRIGKTGTDNGYSVAVDAQGNVYTTGSFSGMVDFDPSCSETTRLTSKGYEDIFVSKLDIAGNLVWAKQLGGSGTDVAYSINLDNQGNILISGHFSETADFDPSEKIHELHSNGKHDIFVCKLDATGNLAWAKQFGGLYDDCGNSIATDALGNIYTTGHFYGVAQFDTLTLEALGSDFPDMFVLKLDATGHLVYANKIGGKNLNVGNSIALDPQGNCYTTGFFKDTIYFNSNIQTVQLVSKGKYDAFISKFNSDGTLAWTKNMGGAGSDFGYTIATDAQSNVYLSGQFEKTAYFDAQKTNDAALTSFGKQDIFIGKWNTDGQLIWTKQLGGAGADAVTSIALDASANIYISGYFSETADFDPSQKYHELISLGQTDIFIAKLDAMGNLAWAKQFGESGADKAQAIALDALGSIYTTGSFENMVDFDANAGVMELTSGGESDIFIHKLKQCTPQSSELEITSCNSFTLNNQVYTASGTYTQVLTTPSGCDNIITLRITINDDTNTSH